MNVICVLPAYNAEETIRDIVRRAAPYVSRVLVVDDGSGDWTPVLARQAAAEVLSLPANRGKGIALRVGLQEALHRGADIVVTLDADGENAPEDIPRLVKPLRERQAHVVLGARTRTHSSLIVGFKTTQLLLRELLALELDDPMSGVRAYTAGAVRKLLPVLRAPGFGIDLEIALLLILLKIPFVEVPVSGELLQMHEGFRPTHLEGLVENLLWFSRQTGLKLGGASADLPAGIKRRDSFRVRIGRLAHEFRYNPVSGLYE